MRKALTIRRQFTYTTMTWTLIRLPPPVMKPFISLVLHVCRTCELVFLCLRPTQMADEYQMIAQQHHEERDLCAEKFALHLCFANSDLHCKCVLFLKC